MTDDDDKPGQARLGRFLAAAEGGLMASCAFSLGAAAAYVLAPPLLAPLLLASFTTFAVSFPAMMVLGGFVHPVDDKHSREHTLVGLGGGLLIGAAAAGLALTAPAFKPNSAFNKVAKVAIAQSLGSVPPTPQTTPQIALNRHYIS